MPSADPGDVLALLKDPKVESQQVAEATGAHRDDVARAARLVMGMAKAKPEEAFSLPGPLAAAVARAALEAGRADVLAALAAHPAREAAKEAKRGLHVLKSRGVEVPEPPRPAPIAASSPAPGPALPCYASALDGEGERAIWVARGVPGRGIEVGQAVVSDVLGLIELQVALLGRKEYRAFGLDIEEKGRAVGVTEIPRERAKSLVAAARHLNEASGRRVPEGADAWLAHLGPAAPLEDPARDFPPLPEDEEREALMASAALHELPMMRGWLAEEEFLRGLARRLDEIAVSPLYLDEHQRAQQAAAAVSGAVESYLDEPRRHRLAGRLFAMAAHLAALGDAESAKAAAAAARAVAGGLPASRIPFARFLVEKAFPSAASPPPPGDAPRGEEPLIIAPR